MRTFEATSGINPKNVMHIMFVQHMLHTYMCMKIVHRCCVMCLFAHKASRGKKARSSAVNSDLVTKENLEKSAI